MQNSILTAVKLATVMIAVTLAPHAFGTANYVYHERTLNDPGCSGNYVTVLNPTNNQAYAMRFKVEYQFFTDTTAVYYTTDGSAPSGAKGVPSGTTQVASGAFVCTFGSPVVDVWGASIPAQPMGTTVKYIVGAWHSGGGDEIFANSGTCGGCGNFNNSSLATVYQYTTGGTTWTGRGTDNLFSAGANWDNALPSAGPVQLAIFDGAQTTKRTIDLAGTGRNCTGLRFDSAPGENGFVFMSTGGGPPGFQPRAVHGIVNNDDSTQTFDVPVKLFTSTGIGGAGAAQTFRAAAGDLVFSGTYNGSANRSMLDLNGGHLTVDGGFNVTLGTTGLGVVSNTSTTVAGIIKNGAGTLTIGGTAPNTYNGTNKLNAGTLSLAKESALGTGTLDIAGNATIQAASSSPRTVTNPVKFTSSEFSVGGSGELKFTGSVDVGSSSSTITVNNSALTIFSGVLSGAGGIVKAGAGTLVLSGANTYSGGTTINAGALRVDNVSGSGTGSGALTIAPGAKLSGSGTISSSLDVSGTLSPGASPGTQNTGSETWNGGANYVWEINDVDAGAGTDPGWDLINITGGLTINATPSSKFTINITSLTLANAPGNVADFDNGQDYTWTILKTTTGITGFDPAAIDLNTSAFSNPLGNGLFTVGLVNGGNDLVLNFVRTPTIAAGPVGGTAECGSTFNFSVTATGTAPLAYQWKHAGTNIPGANGSSLSVTANASTAGNYTVEVSNAYGAATGGPAALTSADTTPPTINCGQNENLACGLAWDFTVPIVSDTCDANPTVSIVSTSTNPICGNYSFVATRIWQAMDQSGNSTMCTQVVTVVDMTAPMITCAADATVECGAAWSFTGPTASDACSGNDVTVTIVSTVTNSVTGGYAVTRTWQATDPCTNSATCSQTITVLDTTPPSITCPANITGVTDGGQCSKSNVTYIASASDTCSSATVVCNPASGSTFALGASTVTCTATDEAGNTNACTFTVTISDTEGPSITCPANIVAGADGGQCSKSNVTYSASASEACSTATVVCDPASGSTFAVGTSTVTCTATDEAGNTNACTFTVTINDTQPPVITCPADAIVECGNSTAPASTGQASATDNCSATIEQNNALPPEVTAGTLMGWMQTVTGSPLTATSAFVDGPSGAPLGTGSARLAVGSNGDGAAQLRSAAYSGILLRDFTELVYRTYRTQDGSGGQMAYIILNIDLDDNGTTDDLLFFEPVYQQAGYNPDLPIQGPPQTGVWQSWDALAGGWWSVNGNAGLNPGASVKSLSTYIAAYPTAKIASTASGAVRFVAGFGAGAWDNFDGNVDFAAIGVDGATISWDFENTAGITCPTTEVIARTFTATDGAGNKRSCTQLITVRDTTAPSLACPSDIATSNDAGQCTAVVTFATTSSDTCSSVNVVCTPASGSAFTVGTTAVNCVATDGCGNTNTCSFNVTVNDTEAPTIACANVVSSTDPGQCTAVVSFTPASSDNCPGALVACTPASGSTFALGATSVSCTITDASGNTNGCTFNVTVNDTEAPTITAPANVTVCADPGQTYATGVALGSPTTGDNCSVASVMNNAPSQFAVGNTTVTWTVTDGSGNPAMALQTVTVNPNPTVTVNSVTVCAGGSATLTATHNASNPSYSWNNGGTTASITVSPASTATYTCTVTDGNTGCSSSGSGTVTVNGFDHFANTGAITINDAAAASPYPSTITVSTLTATVCRVTVSLNGLSHPFPDDLDIALVGPNGEAVLLMSDNGGANALSSASLTFDDLAGGSLPDASQIVSGTFKPSNIGDKSDGRPDNFPAPAPTTRYSTNLSVFNGINPNGVWKLFVFDDELVDNGQIAGGWSLDISTLNPIADVAVAQADIPDPVAVGSNLTYTVTVSNNGPAAANNVLASDTPPAGATLVSFTSSQGSCTIVSGTIWCALGSIAPSGSATVTVVVSPTASGTLVNTASVQADEVDFVSANNSSSASTTVRNPPVITTAPISQTVCADQSVTFSVAATGDAPLSYQWYFGIDPISGANGTTLTLTAVQPAASGGYAVVVQNDVGATSASANLTVNPLPTVSVNSATICNGQSATLTATHNASNPSYLWSPGGATTASITVSPTATSSYSVLVTDGTTGCTNSASGTITVNQLTTATPLTSVTNACPGTSVSFATTANGTGPFTYVWTKNGTVIAGQNGPSLTLASVAAGDAGTYCVEVTGVCNSVTNCATLTVATAPTIASQPQNQITPMGNTATFSVTANGPAPLSYQWKENGVDIPGATSSSVTVGPVTLAQSGNTYSVTVSNCAGTVTSSAATLTVTPISGISFDFDTAGQFTNTPYNVTLNDWLVTRTDAGLPTVLLEAPSGGVNGSGAVDVTGTVDTTMILHPVSYDFSQDGKTLNASVMIRIVAPSQNNRNTQLAFVTSTNTYNGALAVGINDNNPQGFMSVILQSTAQPALTYQLRLQHRRTDGGLTEVTPTPTPQATLTAGTWYKLIATFRNIKGTVADNFSVAASLQDMGANGITPGAVAMSYPATNIANASLTAQKNMFLAIRSARSDTGADFWDNVYANATTGPVFFVTPPASQTVPQGRQVTFTARVDGDGPYTYQWNKNGSPIAGARNWKYITAPVRLAESGDQYTVTVTGPGNTVTSDPAILTVTPDTLAVVSVGSVDGGSIGVQFNQPVDRTTAENAANYLINGQPAQGARVFTSSVDLNPTRVIITPCNGALTGPYTVTVQNVLDLSGNPVGGVNSANGRVEGFAGVDINPLVVQPGGYQNSFAPGQFEISGAGVDIFTSPDSLRYVYRQQTGDFDIKVRVPYQDVVRGPTKSGFEARLSLDPTAPQILAAVNPKWPARMQYEGTFRQVYGSGGNSYGNSTRITYPDAWLRFRRVGNTFMRYSSVNGTTWLFDGQVSPSPAFPDTIYLGLEVCSVANGSIQTASFDNYGNFGGYPGAIITITGQPIGAATVVAGNSSNLTVTATISGAPAAGELAYVWQRNAGGGVWTNVPAAGNTNNTFNTGALFASDNGAEYRVVVKAPGAADVVSSSTIVTVTDAAGPTITAATIPIGANAQVLITYSEPMGASAINAANYVVSNQVGGASLGVSSASFLGLDTRTVLLTTANPLNAGSYGLRVTGVQDLAGNNINPNPTTRSLSQAGTAPVIGPVVVEVYSYLTNGGATTGIQDLTNNTVASFAAPSVKFANDTPDFTTYSNVFAINPGGAFPSTIDHYGAQMYTYFVPPTSGQYKFYLRVDDYGQFFMNTNAVGSTNPAGAVLQINITGASANYTAANSVTNTLVAGQRYYMEVRFKESTGGDGVSVAVRTDNTVPAQAEVIPASQMEFPAAIAKPTPVVVELYTGLVTLNSLAPNDVGAAFGNGGYPDFIAAMNSSAVIARNPNVIGYARYFGYNTNLAQVNATFDNYFGRLYGNFIAPSNGLYRFWVRADDSCELWMNTNAVNSTDPAGMSRLGVVNDFYNANYRLLAENVFLTGGQRYYMEGRWREGTGGDGMTVTFRAQSDTSIPPTTEVITGNRLEFPSNFDRVGAIDAQMSPLNPVVSDGQTITFQAVGLRGSPGYGVSWFKNGVQVAANQLTFLTQPLGASDNGATITMVATNAFSRVERSTTITVLSDTTSPTILSAVGSQYQELVVLTFSEPLDALTAGAAANYQMNNGVGVLSATLDPDTRRRVTLRTTPQTPGTAYIVTVNNVRDAAVAGNPIAPNTQVAFTAWLAAGKGLYVELFTNIGGGTAVLNLQSDPKYINNWPDIAYYTNRLGASWLGNDSGLNNYGARVSGYLAPPSNGLYRLYIRGDDGTQLFMNTNGPAASGRVLVARSDGANSGAWDNGTGGSATPILSLNADTLYFTEALMKEGGGGDHLEVMLRAIDPVSLAAVGGVPAVSVNDIAAGDLFVAAGNPDRASLTVSQTPVGDVTVAQNDTVTLAARAYAGNFELSMATGYRWQASDGIGGFVNIPGAWGPTYQFVAGDSDTQYRVVIGGPGTNVSYTTTVHSSTDTKAPFMISASSLNGTNLDILWNEPLEPNSAVDPFNYTINDGAVNIVPGGIVQRDDPRKITITVDASVGSTFTIFANGVVDLANNYDITSVTGRVSSGFVALDVGAPVAAGSTFNVAEGEFDVVAGGNDIWGNSDVGHLTLTQITGDFDISLRIAGLTRPDAIAKGGLMIRESLAANSRTLHALVNPSQYQQAHPLNPTILTGRDIADGAQRFATGGGTAGWQARPESVGPPSQIGNSSFSPAGVPNAWVRYKREGNMFYAYHGYDGVNWRLYGQCPFIFDKTVYVGMGTCAHTASQAANLVAVANYRDVYIPPAPIILVQPSPSSQTVSLHASVTYSVVASNPPPNKTALKYQWFRNGIAITGATGTSVTISDAKPADAGVYTVEVNNDGGTVTSIPVTLNVDSGLVAGNDAFNTVQNQSLTLDASTLLANDSASEGSPTIVGVSGIFPVTYTGNFDSGLPAGAQIFGSATLEAAGGANNSGNVRLNPGVASQGGSLILPDLSPNRRVTAFNASFKLRIADGSGQPADGFSFNFAPDIPIAATTAAAAENGGGTGFSFCIDNYQFHPYPNGGIANSSGMKIRYGNLDIIGVRSPAWVTPRWVDVNINVTAQGRMTVLVDGTNVFGTITLPNYTPRPGRFGIYGRTGGEFQSHAIDDLSITALTTIETTRDPAINTDGERLVGSAAISGGILRLTEAAASLQGTYMTPILNTQAMTSMNVDFKVRIGGGTARAADGLSVSIAPDLSNASFGEEGAGSYLVVSLDTWDNNGTDTAPAFDVKWGGTADANIVATKSFQPSARYQREGGRATATPPLLDGSSQPVLLDTDPADGTPTFVPLSIAVKSDGTLDLTYKGVPVFQNLALPGFFGATNLRVGIGGRTGGATDNHWVDDLAVTINQASGPVVFNNDFNTTPPSPYGTVVLNGSQVVYTPPANVCGSDTFYYMITGLNGGTALGRVDVNIAEATPTPPTITACATNRTLTTGLNCVAALPDMTAEIRTVDNCCCPSISQNPPPGTLLPRGVHIVTFTATDTAGLTAQCQATITIADQSAPIIALIGSGPITIECHSTSAIPGATATDDCDGDLTSQIVVGGDLDRNVPGSYTVTYDVSDSSGNAATQMQRIVNVVDTTPPSITCPANITTTCTGNGGATVTYSASTSDVCDAAPSLVCTPASGSLFPAGVTTVNCVATDASGNTNRCSFTVTVNDNPAQLTIERGAGTVTISYPQTCGTFILQQNDNLADANAWVAAPTQPTLVSGRWTITINSTTPTTLFYRLRSN